MPSAGGLSSGGGSGLSGLSGGTGGGAGGGAGAAPPPASQFLSGAAQGLANPSTLASGASAAAAQPFKPPFKASTYLLWLGPAVIIVTGLAAVVLYHRRKVKAGAAGDSPGLSDDEQARLARLLDDEPR